MSNSRKYLFAYFNADTGEFSDVYWFSTVQHVVGNSLDGEELNKFVDGVSSAKVANAIYDALDNVKRDNYSQDNLAYAIRACRQFACVHRRAQARKLRALLQKDAGSAFDVRIIEVGDFARTVRPVKHWNVMRKRRRRTAVGSKQFAWVKDTGPSCWGISVREDARRTARDLTEAWNREDDGYEYRFTAVPVYA